MKKRFYHRGYNVELCDEQKEQYAARVNGKRIIGSLLGVKQSIDWWCDTHILQEPDEFEKQTFKDVKERKIEEYKDTQIMNDSEEKENEWYMIINGSLIKGSLNSLKKYVDKREAQNWQLKKK